MAKHHPVGEALISSLSTWFQEDRPWEAGFISLMRAVAAKTPHLPPPGMASLPSQEAFRLGQCANMTFAPREISQLGVDNGKVQMELFGLGVWGPQGAMPLHMTELTYSRTEANDRTLQNFLNIFHHRALSLFYRTWFLAQDTASLDRQHDEKFSFYVGSLAGLDPQELNGELLPTHARLASSAHLIREARNPEGLVGALKYFFEVPVEMEEFARQWIFLDRTDQTSLGNEESAMLLGDGAILGNTVQDRQHKFKLIFGPLTLDQYMRFSPWGQDLPVLREWVRNFIGFEYAWDAQLLLAAEEIPAPVLDGTQQLGYACWLERKKSDVPVSGMSFEPEMYQYGLR